MEETSTTVPFKRKPRRTVEVDHDPTKADAISTAVALERIGGQIEAGNIARVALSSKVEDLSIKTQRLAIGMDKLVAGFHAHDMAVRSQVDLVLHRLDAVAAKQEAHEVSDNTKFASLDVLIDFFSNKRKYLAFVVVGVILAGGLTGGASGLVKAVAESFFQP